MVTKDHVWPNTAFQVYRSTSLNVLIPDLQEKVWVISAIHKFPSESTSSASSQCHHLFHRCHQSSQFSQLVSTKSSISLSGELRREGRGIISLYNGPVPSGSWTQSRTRTDVFPSSLSTSTSSANVRRINAKSQRGEQQHVLNLIMSSASHQRSWHSDSQTTQIRPDVWLWWWLE